MTLSQHSSCTTILVGKNASYDGSTLIARNEDAGGPINPKNFKVVKPEDQPQDYHAKLSKFSVKLPDNPLRYTSLPDVEDDGVWGEAGINSKNVAMSATETITTNPRILGADPLVKDGFGEEDLLTITLPYVSSAREGVARVGELLKQYGTYESNGIIFSDVDEVWYLETAGGHHWVAQRVPDDAYVVAPNQTGIQEVDFNDPNNFMFADDLREFVEKNHLNLNSGFNFREIFGSHSPLDHHYNTPRAWYVQGYFDPESIKDKEPISDELPFICHANRKITIEDIKFALSSHYQETNYDPFAPTATEGKKYRPIGFNRNQELSLLQIRPYAPAESAAIHWLALGTNPFNTIVPFYANVNDTPSDYQNGKPTVDSNNAYWLNKLIGLIANDHFHTLIGDIEDYQEKTLGYGHLRISQTDSKVANLSGADLQTELETANQETADNILATTKELLTKVVAKASEEVTGAFTHDQY
ncbi:C69 family dipeptidase [Lentilactobacillus sp. Marseille-Q4993]|uniref:C69 family dipeptidase n=1 Tax=Lentilactobacillus sp. Marseille-Q4993 TaxID=3039492 RepID=UPI0024BCD0F0|nr:C69 family dipeptidase [Lentilactobacillus sp. Marseille-Q4993]